MSGIRFDYCSQQYVVFHFKQPEQRVTTMEEARALYKQMSGYENFVYTDATAFSLQVTTTDSRNLCSIQRKNANPFLSKKNSQASKNAKKKKKKTITSSFTAAPIDPIVVVVNNEEEDEEEMEKRLKAEEEEMIELFGSESDTDSASGSEKDAAEPLEQ